jgi:hypothetical protein
MFERKANQSDSRKEFSGSFVRQSSKRGAGFGFVLEHRFDAALNVASYVAFPESRNVPSLVKKLSGDSQIAGNVISDLAIPIATIIDAFELLLQCELLSDSILVSVPEIAINKDRESAARYDYVRLARQFHITHSEAANAAPP